MNKIEIEGLAKSIKKGTYVRMEWKSNPKLLKEKTLNADKVVEKKSIGVVRLGIDYANLKVNDGKETGSLPYGEWGENDFTYLISYNGEWYLRVYTTNIPVKTTYLLNGNETTKEYLVDNGILSASTKPHTECFNVNIKNIISIGGEG